MTLNRDSRIKLGGRQVRRVGLGTNRLTDTDDNRAFLQAAVEAGIEMIDTAHLYTDGASETTIGNALAPFADSLCSWRDQGRLRLRLGHHHRRAAIELELSFDRLQTDRIELYYVHRLHPEVPHQRDDASCSPST